MAVKCSEKIENLRKILRFFDLCSVSFSFKYMDEDKYTTSLGGLVSIIFFFLGAILFVINFIPFRNNQNFTLQDYIVNTNQTEEINLTDSTMAFAIGLDCPTDEKTHIKAEDLFDLKVSFITYTKDDNGTRNKEYKEIKTHPCNHSDFHNENKESFDLLNIDKLQCLNKEEEKLEGIYTDKLFTYYEFSLMAKENSAEHYKKIDDYLIENDCKLQFYYTDITLDLANYTHPIKSFINSLFLQINPTLFLKMNVFFMNYHLSDDKVYIPLINKEKKPLLKTGFSRDEQYFLEKGTDRFSNKPNNYDKYANLYIRVDKKKIEIKRKYQNLLEFYADNSSLLISLFVFINFVISLYNTFKSNLSISSRLFFNEEKQNHNKIKLLIRGKKYKDNSNIHNEINGNDNCCETKDEIIDQEEKQDPMENQKLEKKWSFSSIYYCCCKEKRKWYKQARKILDSRLDIFYYIRKMILLEFIIGDYFDNKNQNEINHKSRIFKCIDFNIKENLECYYKWSMLLDIDNFLNDFEKKKNKKNEKEKEKEKKEEENEKNNENENNEIGNIENRNNGNGNNENKNIENGMKIYRIKKI